MLIDIHVHTQRIHGFPRLGKAAFEPLRAKDPPAAAYWRKCQALLAEPPVAREGVWGMTEK